MIGPVVGLPEPGGFYRWHGANDSAAKDYLQVYRNYIGDIVTGHENLRRVAAAEGITGVPESVTAAKDWAFASYRLASLKLDRPGHPISGDHVFPVAFAGATRVMTQPNSALSARLKRAAWIVALALTPPRFAVVFLGRTVFRHMPHETPQTEDKAALDPSRPSRAMRTI